MRRRGLRVQAGQVLQAGAEEDQGELRAPLLGRDQEGADILHICEQPTLQQEQEDRASCGSRKATLAGRFYLQEGPLPQVLNAKLVRPGQPQKYGL